VKYNVNAGEKEFTYTGDVSVILEGRDPETDKAEGYDNSYIKAEPTHTKVSGSYHEVEGEKATCEKEGLATYKCAVCEKPNLEEVIPKTAHVPGTCIGKYIKDKTGTTSERYDVTKSAPAEIITGIENDPREALLTLKVR
jgi:hypothetical protein